MRTVISLSLFLLMVLCGFAAPDTSTIQALIDGVPAAGGIATVPAGEYVCGTLRLRSNLEIHLSPGTVILGSQDIADYDTNVQASSEAPSFSKCLVYAENATNLTIEGPGTVNGRGSQDVFPSPKDGKFRERPMLMRFINCTGLRLHDLDLRNAASWCCHFVNCQDVHIDGVDITSLLNRNNDGFDLDGCRDVFISNCNLDTEDDTICGKSTLRATENLLVTNCKLTSRTAGFKLGTSSAGGFKDIVVNNCLFRDCHTGAIKLLCVDGGTLENVTISDIVMDNVDGPLFIRLGSRGIRFDQPREIADDSAAKLNRGQNPPGVLRHVIIRNLHAEVAGKNPKSCGILIIGIPGHPIEDVTLEDADFSFPGGGTAEQASLTVPENENIYPEQAAFGILPAWAAYVRHVDGITLRNVKFNCRNADARLPFKFDDVTKLYSSEIFINNERGDNILK